MQFRCIALFVLAFTGLGQQPANYTELKAALGLSDIQLIQLRQLRAVAAAAKLAPQTTDRVYNYAARRAGDFDPMQQAENSARDLGLAVLTEDQRTKLDAVAGILRRGEAARQFAALGVISCGQWPGTCDCLFYPIRQDNMGLGLSESQLMQLRPLQKARLDTMREAQQANQNDDITASRQLVLNLLDYSQKVKVAEFDADLRIVNEAIAAGLIVAPPRGEPLCN